MGTVYHYHHTVEPREIDALGHASNVAYVEWMQSAALAHSAAQGWPAEAYRRLGQGFVVREHRIEYLRPARLGDAIVVETWVATMRKASSLRRYRMLRPADKSILAEAETRWAFVDLETGQPARIPSQIAQAFQIRAGLSPGK